MKNLFKFLIVLIALVTVPVACVKDATPQEQENEEQKIDKPTAVIDTKDAVLYVSEAPEVGVFSNADALVREFQVSPIADNTTVQATGAAEGVKVEAEFDPATGKGRIGVLITAQDVKKNKVGIKVTNPSGNKNYSFNVESAFISVDTSLIPFGEEGGEGTFSIDANVPYTVSSEAGWVEGLKTEKNNVSFAVPASKTLEEKEAVITINDDNNRLCATVTVRQAAVSDELTLLTDRELLMRVYEREKPLSDEKHGIIYSRNWGSDLPLSEWGGIRATKDDIVYYIEMGCNAFHSLPPEFGYLDELRYLDIGGTDTNEQLTGEIPDSWRRLEKLRDLTIMNTGITGTFPEWLTEFPVIDRITITGNRITGELPLYLKDVSETCIIINFAQNCLDGEIPEELTQTRWWQGKTDILPEPWKGAPACIFQLMQGQKEGHRLWLPGCEDEELYPYGVDLSQYPFDGPVVW